MAAVVMVVEVVRVVVMRDDGSDGGDKKSKTGSRSKPDCIAFTLRLCPYTCYYRRQEQMTGGERSGGGE